MERQRILLDGWPALMSLDLASRYLSVSEASFRRIAAQLRVDPVELEAETPLWRKSDLDRVVSRLPVHKGFSAFDRPAAQVRMSDALIDKIAAATAKYIGEGEAPVAPVLVSIKDAQKMLGVGRTTLYRLINEGQLATRQIGSRTLILKTAINALLEAG